MSSLSCPSNSTSSQHMWITRKLCSKTEAPKTQQRWPQRKQPLLLMWIFSGRNWKVLDQICLSLVLTHGSMTLPDCLALWWRQVTNWRQWHVESNSTYRPQTGFTQNTFIVSAAPLCLQTCRVRSGRGWGPAQLCKEMHSCVKSHTLTWSPALDSHKKNRDTCSGHSWESGPQLLQRVINYSL